MATQAVQAPAEITVNDSAATPSSETSPVLSKESETSSTPAEACQLVSKPPEPSEEAGSSKTTGVSGTSAAAAGASESKPEPEGKAAVAKTKKKEDKSIEYILRALSSLNSPEEKLAALCKKYADLHEEHRVLQTSFKQQQRKMTVVQREKDQLQAEHTKAVIAKSKLESLCRELQKQNKAVKEESILRQKEEEEVRKDISNKFQATIKEIQTQMTENHEKNVKLREENHDLAGKLRKFLEQHEVREEQLDKIMKHRELEAQLADAKLQKVEAVMKEEQERHIKEKELMLLQTAETQKKNTMLETQLNMYKDRYEEFQGTINKSNDMFQKLKSEMDKMGKRIKKLEKEGAQWKAKWESSNKALLEMAEEKSRSDKEKQLLQTKIIKLESLCRALQGEMHGKKSSSPQPSSSGDSDGNATTVESTTEPTAVPTTTSTPPNTPEENTSRASPNPESQSILPQPLPTGQNGPVSVSASASASASSLSDEAETSRTPEATAAEEKSSEQHQQTSSTCEDVDSASAPEPAVPGNSMSSSLDSAVPPVQDETV